MKKYVIIDGLTFQTKRYNKKVRKYVKQGNLSKAEYMKSMNKEYILDIQNYSDFVKEHDKFIAEYQEYQQSNMRKYQAKIRGLGYNELCKNPYPKEIKVVYHHINDTDVIPIPASIHRKFTGTSTSEHRKLIAKWLKKNYPIPIPHST